MFFVETVHTFQFDDQYIFDHDISKVMESNPRSSVFIGGQYYVLCETNISQSYY